MSAAVEDLRSKVAAMPHPLASNDFPVESFREAAPHLRRPFDPLAIKWKVQAAFPKGNPNTGLVVSYIDRGLVIDRLNLVVPHLWSATYEDLERERGHMLCRLTIDGITREDVGEGATAKARRSDSLKRAAVHFGVGVSLSRVPQSKLTVASGRVRAQGQGDRATVVPTQEGLDYLRERYAKWLEQVGERAFGPVLDHGDLGDAQGDDTDHDDPLAQPAAVNELYARLADGTRTVRQQRALLSAVGVTGLPNAATPHHIEQALGTLTEEQANRLRSLLDQQPTPNGDAA
jgi:hypothetical protein